MITTRLDSEMIVLTNFTHPTHGALRIIGDYDTNPSQKGSTEPTYKCQQTEGAKNFFMLPKSLVKELIAKGK